LSRREGPIRRVNPSGAVVWVARYTGRDGKRRYAKPAWNRGSATFARRRDAQRAIEEAYALPDRLETLAGYLETWPARYPRSARTNKTNAGRVRAVLGVEIEGRPLGEWPLHELRRRHALALVDAMLRDQGRASSGATNVLRSLSALAEDAITDELAEGNPFKGVRVRADDPRARKRSREVRVYSFEQLHGFAAAARAEVRARLRRPGSGRPYPALDYEPMLRTFTDSGLRLGEVLALRRRDFDGESLRVRGSAHEGRILAGSSRQKNHDRLVPCPPGLAAMLGRVLLDSGGELLFPTPSGRVWWERNFYRDVWEPAQAASGLDVRPHECRHSWVTHLHAAGVNGADLAEMAGHRVETMISRYTHPLRRSMEQVKEVIG